MIPEYQKKATKKYKEKNYERICLDYRKGTRDEWKKEAEKRGLSLAGLISAAVAEYLENHREE